MLLKYAITQTAGTILNRIERVTYKDWFDAECEQGTINKKQSIQKGCNKEIILRKQWRNIELPEEKKKEYANKRRRYLWNVDLRNWNVSEVTTKANPSIEN